MHRIRFAFPVGSVQGVRERIHSPIKTGGRRPLNPVIQENDRTGNNGRPTGKTPRHTLTPAEKQKCLEALRRERCARRADAKEERARKAAAAAKEAAAEAKEAAAEAKTAADDAKTAAKDAEAIVAEEIDTQEAEKAPPAEAKTSGKTKKAPSRKKAP
ncbi:hypothetical protein PR003_g28242, partial [Phytophthora rubi]